MEYEHILRGRRSTDIGLSSLIDGAIDPAGFTERVSNAIAFHGPDPFEFIGSNDAGTSDDLYLKIFLHEVTHHFSFSDALGVALSSLSVSCLAHRDDNTDEDGKLSLPSRDLIVDTSLFTIMEPMIEGAALFAEFDTVSGQSEILSPGMLHGLHLMIPSLAKRLRAAGVRSSVDPFAMLSERLLQARLSSTSVEDKMNLLGSPLSENRGYLLGYLAVKSFYFNLRRRSHMIHDPEFFLSGFMKHFFYDEALARIALSADDLDPIRVHHTLEMIIEHLQDRWRDLHDHTSARFKSYHDEILGRDPKLDAGFTPSERSVIDDLTVLALIRTASLSMQVLWPSLFKYRHIIRYSGRRTFITITNDGEAELRREPTGPVVLTCPIVQLADKGEYEGTVELVCSQSGDTRAIVVLGESGLVSAWNPATGVWNEQAVVEQLDSLPAMNLIIAAAKQISDAVTDRLQRLPTRIRDVLDTHQDQAKEFAKFFYLQIMCPYWKPEKRTALGDVLLERGFGNIFSENYLREVARYSIVFGGHGRSIEEGSRLIGLKKTKVQDEVKRINAKTNAKLGLDMLALEGETITSLL